MSTAENEIWIHSTETSDGWKDRVTWTKKEYEETKSMSDHQLRVIEYSEYLKLHDAISKYEKLRFYTHASNNNVIDIELMIETIKMYEIRLSNQSNALTAQFEKITKLENENKKLKSHNDYLQGNG